MPGAEQRSAILIAPGAERELSGRERGLPAEEGPELPRALLVEQRADGIDQRAARPDQIGREKQIALYKASLGV